MVRPSHLRILVALLASLALTLPISVRAQWSDPTNASPRGLTEVPPPATTASAPSPAATFPSLARPPAQLPSANRPGTPPGPLPVDPGQAAQPVVFGSQMFTGRFGSEAFTGFNPEYRIAVGDRITIRLWGAYNFETTQAVDAQGNVFLPNIGPLRVLGLRNADLNGQVQEQVKRVFRANVSAYATLESAQPVKVYVSGSVRAPGLYGGLSSDSVLYYLDRAGGIDPERGSFLEVEVVRNGRAHARIDLYRFLLEGRMEPLQLQDGDTVVALPRKHTAQVRGDVLNPYLFEFRQPQIPASTLLALARPRPSATHLSIVRRIGAQWRSEYHALADAAQTVIQDGDEVAVTSDKYPGTILVRVDGAHLGERMLVMPYGARLKDAVARLKPAEQAALGAMQLFRQSVAVRQKELLDASLRSLETYALTARSATSEEAALRTREADQILKFVERARQAQPRGQVVLAGAEHAGETLLEDGDVIRVPEASNLILVSGEVSFPNAVIYVRDADVDAYVARAGGYTQGADRARVMVARQDGSVVEAAGAALRPGDEIMVLPKIQTKNVEITRGLTQIIYQIAVAARIALGL
jgi:protein involved in polysaccharide export with SLBB domain